MKISERIKKDWPILLLMMIVLVVSIVLYPSLPEKVPSHWNIKGEIDAYSSKLFGVLGINMMNIGMYFLFIILPNLDPRRENYVKFGSAYNLIRYVMHLFFVMMQIVILTASFGYEVDVAFLITVGVGIMFLLLGNVMGKIKHNYFVGIKTPWTLADERVWVKTHRFAAPLWVIGGLVVIISAFFGGIASFITLMVVLVIMVIIPFIYSYKCFKEFK